MEELRLRGLRVAMVKHDAYGVQVDRPCKDSDPLFRDGHQGLSRPKTPSPFWAQDLRPLPWCLISRMSQLSAQ